MASPDNVGNPASFWTQMPAADIPTKKALHGDFMQELEACHGRAADSSGVLDLGCGDGRLTLELAKRFPNFRFLGVDVSDQAIDAAKGRAVDAGLADTVKFESEDGTKLQDRRDRFQVVLAQLVLSIVGCLEKRHDFLRCAGAVLADGGRLLMSVSGASADINAEYAALYAKEASLTGEQHTYFSRAADGTVLYPTHHFTETELRDLLTNCGLSIVRLTREREASSRRPDQAAWFFYVVAERVVSTEPAAKRQRRNAIAPGSDAFNSAVCVGFAHLQPFQVEASAADVVDGVDQDRSSSGSEQC